MTNDVPPWTVLDAFAWWGKRKVAGEVSDEELAAMWGHCEYHGNELVDGRAERFSHAIALRLMDLDEAYADAGYDADEDELPEAILAQPAVRGRIVELRTAYEGVILESYRAAYARIHGSTAPAGAVH
jgi:hypothetical protein